MKKFLLFNVLFISVFAFSQNPLLFNKNWKVEKSIVNGTEIDISNDPIGYFMTFNNNYFYNYTSQICTDNYGKATFSNNSDDFVITEAKTSSPGNCSAPANLDNNYSLFFTKHSSGINKITYSIEQNANKYKLTLTNVSGDQLFFIFHEPPIALVSKTWHLFSFNIGSYEMKNPATSIGYLKFTNNLITNSYYDQAGQSNINFISDNKFQAVNWSVLTPIPGDDPALSNYASMYFYSFFDVFNNFSHSSDPISYEISGDEKKLTITKYNGDFAVYYDSVMAVSETNKPTYKIYPNPVSDILTIENLKPNFSLEIMDASGKIVRKISDNKSAKTEINIKNLSSGIYYLKINNESIHKIIRK